MSKKTQVKYLVTGGAGFIGSNFIRHALQTQQNWSIVNLDALTYAGCKSNLQDVEKQFQDRYRFIHGDICDLCLLNRLFECDTFHGIIHFAAESHVDRSITGPETFVETNVLGTFRLLKSALNAWQNKKTETFRFIHVSTDEVYGSLGSDGYFSETTAYDPSSPYSASKAASDHFVKAYYRTYGLPTLITNCSNNYGPYQFPEKLIPLIIMNIIKEKPLPVYGDGKNIRDWLYVIDHCEAIIKVLESGVPGETYNVGGNSEYQNIQVVELLCDILDRKLARSDKNSSRNLITFVDDRLGHDQRYAIDASKIRSNLGWVPRYRFEEALGETVDWYLNNLEWISSVQ